MSDIWLISGLTAPLAFLILVLVIENRYLKRRVERLTAKLDGVNLKLDEANQRYDVSLLGFDPIECEEHHLPGDCPLCGAE